MQGEARALTLQNLFTRREKDASSCQEQLDEFRKLVGAMRKWLKESEGKMPPAETSLGTQELHQRRQQIQVGGGSRNRPGKADGWCGNAGRWNKSREAESWGGVLRSQESWGSPMCVCTQRSLPCGEGSSGKVLLGAAWFPFPPRASSEWD